jgi:hypothetical protein
MHKILIFLKNTRNGYLCIFYSLNPYQETLTETSILNLSSNILPQPCHDSQIDSSAAILLTKFATMPWAGAKTKTVP